MKEFWKNEWQLFLDDMQTLGEFFLQPVTFSPKTLQLQASVEEREQETEVQDVGIWDSFKQGCSNAKDFLFQPVKFKF
ncbi:MAG: hypothetical protein ACLTON_06505 [Christensenellales bacterium]|jgi:hypothetical protein|nr:unknown [Clostridium sp. CAG:465]